MFISSELGSAVRLGAQRLKVVCSITDDGSNKLFDDSSIGDQIFPLLYTMRTGQSGNQTDAPPGKTCFLGGSSSRILCSVDSFA